LIHGIQSFDPSLLAKARLDPAQMDLLFNGLKQLFLEVQGAFIASASAILGAMLVTLLEKVSINACYYRLEQLCLKLDALYEGGVAEVYLAALVKSSAENVTHTAQLKASLVTELSELLRELTAKQIEQSEIFATMLADKLTGKIQEQIEASADHGELFRTELKSGLDSMGDKVASIAGGQGDTVTGILEQLIEKFSGTISSAFNEQMQEIGGMINQAAASMQTTQTGFDGLIKDLRNTGEQERQAANEQMLRLMTAMDNRQEASQAQIQGFIEAINTQISNAQQNNAAQIRDSLKEIQLSTQEILANIEQDRINARSEEQQQQKGFTDAMSSTFTEQMKRMGSMFMHTSTAIQTMQSGFETLMTDLRDTGTQERQAVNSEIQELVTLIGQQQVTLQSQMEGFITAINTQISNAQQDNSNQIRDSLSEIQSSTRQILADMDKKRNTAIAVEQERQQQFANTVSSTFTQQVDNVGGMLEQTSTAMQTMQGGFETLMQNLRETGEQERKAVSAEMSALVNELENRQTVAQTNISDFVSSIATKHQDTLKITQENLTELQTSTRKILADMEGERAALLQAERDRQQAFIESSNALISKIDSQISALVTQVSNTMSALKDNTIELNNAGDKMTDGAEKISQASSNFAAAGNKVSGVLEQTEKLSTQLMTTGNQMSSAAEVLETQLKEYTATCELLGRMITDMETLLNRAKQESGMNQQIVADMQKMVGSFGVLKDDMDDFVTQVGGLLAQTLAKFQNDMATHNTEFHKYHADTLKQVANAYQPLSASISGLIDMFARTNNRGV
jgi:putative membrane protein